MIIMAKYFRTSQAYLQAYEDKPRRISLSRLSSIEKRIIRRSRNLSPSEQRRMLMRERERLLNNKEDEKSELVLLYVR